MLFRLSLFMICFSCFSLKCLFVHSFWLYYTKYQTFVFLKKITKRKEAIKQLSLILRFSFRKTLSRGMVWLSIQKLVKNKPGSEFFCPFQSTRCQKFCRSFVVFYTTWSLNMILNWVQKCTWNVIIAWFPGRGKLGREKVTKGFPRVGFPPGS